MALSIKTRGITLNKIAHVTPDYWQYLFSPASVAVIGASNTPGSWGNNAMKGALSAGNKRVYPVNPNSPEVMGKTAYKSVVEIPDTIDLAVIVVPEKLVPEVMRECVAKAVRAAIIITSGFAETGEPGRKLEAEVLAIARQGGIRFIGPNSMGHADTGSKLSTFGQMMDVPRGPVAVLSQSGSTCMKIVRALAEVGVSCSKYVSTGNEADLYLEDYLEYLAGDDSTQLIAAYIEGLRDGRRFFRLAKEITKTKPIVIVKIGGTEESARAIMSHTGALAGSDAVYTAAFKQSGVIRTEDDDELCDVVGALCHSPLPRNNRVGILTIGGGQGALAAEICEKEGLAVGKLEPETVLKLDKILPQRWPHRNPVDMAGPNAADLSQISNLLWPLMEDKNLDIILLLVPVIMDNSILTGRMGLKPEQIKTYRENEARNIMLIRENIEKYEKPVALMWQGRGVVGDSSVPSQLRKGKILTFTSIRRTARVMNLLYRYRQYLNTVKSEK
jgi:acyl-CoA synthetase (NDP forming)